MRGQDGPKPLFSLPEPTEQQAGDQVAIAKDFWTPSKPSTPQDTIMGDSQAGPFLPPGLTQSGAMSSPTPSICGTKFTPLKRVKKGPASVTNNSQPSTPGNVNTHTKRPSITSGTTEVASTSPGPVDAADYGIHGKKLATMYSNPSAGTSPAQDVDGVDIAQDLVLLHISLIIPPNSSPAYARHQRRMLRRKRLDDDSSAISVSDLGFSDEEATGEDADSESLEPGPLSMLSPVVYQRGILIPHPRGDYVLLQREVGKTLGLPFVNGEDGENVLTDEDGGVRGKGWHMRVYARNGWLTKGAWERAWREMERVDVEILESERDLPKPKKHKPRRTKQLRGATAKASSSSRTGAAQQDFPGLAGNSPEFPAAGVDSRTGSGDAPFGQDYSDPGDSLDEDNPAGGSDLEDDTGLYDENPRVHDNNTLDVSDIEDVRGDKDPHTSYFPQSRKRAPLQLENGTVGDGELEEAYRVHEAGLDELEEDGLADDHDTPPSPTLSNSVSSSGSRSPSGSRKPETADDEKPQQSRGKSPFSFVKRGDVHPYQHLLNILKPIILTGIVVTGAMFFFGPTHKRNGNHRGRYGSWSNPRDYHGGSAIHIDDDRVDMDQDIEDHCAGFAKEAEMWRSWKDHINKDGGSSIGGLTRKGGNGDWTVTVTQTVTQRIVNAGATQIVVEIPSGDAQFPLGPLGLSERDSLEMVEFPIETSMDGPITTLPPSADGEEVKAGENDGTAASGEEESGQKTEGEGVETDSAKDPESSTDPDEVVYEDVSTKGNWWGKLGL